MRISYGVTVTGSERDGKSDVRLWAQISNKLTDILHVTRPKFHKHSLILYPIILVKQ